jgi:hypothetical protein
MLGLAAVPAVVQVVCTFLWLPETPRWLTADGNEFGAMAVLVRLRQNEMEALEEFEMIRDSIGSELIATAAGSHMSSVALKRALCVGMGLQAFQQLVGINAVMYFGATVFQAAGVAGGSKTGAVSFFSSFSASVAIFGILDAGRSGTPSSAGPALLSDLLYPCLLSTREAGDPYFYCHSCRQG